MVKGPTSSQTMTNCSQPIGFFHPLSVSAIKCFPTVSNFSLQSLAGVFFSFYETELYRNLYQADFLLGEVK